MKIINIILITLAIIFIYSTAYYSQQNGGKHSSVEPKITIEFNEPIVVVIKVKPKVKPIIIKTKVPTRNEFVNMVTACYNDINHTLKLKLPIEIVIAQAGLESGWGKSRFALEGNNLFGVREFNLDKPHLKAKGAPDARWGVKVYKTYCGSVEHYMKLLSEAGIYGQFQNELRYQYSVVTNGNYNWKAMVDTYASIYAEDQDYTKKVVNTINKLKQLNLI